MTVASSTIQSTGKANEEMKKSGSVQKECDLKGMLGRYSRLDELSLIEP